ncbi:unnamed protein product, partial [Allacma fusca]
MRIERPGYQGLSSEFIQAGQELGLPHTDLNGYYTKGIDYIYYPIRRGSRDAVFNAFIKPARRRPNLTIFKFAHVNKILFKDGNVAHGVVFDRHGEQRTVYAT